MEYNLWKADIQWNLCLKWKTTFDGTLPLKDDILQPLIPDEHRQKMTFNGRQHSLDDNILIRGNLGLNIMF